MHSEQFTYFYLDEYLITYLQKNMLIMKYKLKYDLHFTPQ